MSIVKPCVAPEVKQYIFRIKLQHSSIIYKKYTLCSKSLFLVLKLLTCQIIIIKQYHKINNFTLIMQATTLLLGTRLGTTTSSPSSSPMLIKAQEIRGKTYFSLS